MKLNFVDSKLILKSNKNLNYKYFFNNGKSFINFFYQKINEKPIIENKITLFNNIGKMLYENDEINYKTKIFGNKFVNINKKKAKIIINFKKFNFSFFPFI